MQSRQARLLRLLSGDARLHLASEGGARTFTDAAYREATRLAQGTRDVRREHVTHRGGFEEGLIMHAHSTLSPRLGRTRETVFTVLANSSDARIPNFHRTGKS